ncbi:uncharacterized protein CLUP02_06781 [Colletotrichum lupini]|uniref:Uncharacterized protein n=1 Tax=Colletotrichum lupini TaxID=145971 RepID=A0A9Q8SQN1_9PEZI|nr:uncharacterized protein CLUP02_06781 [Colletotrichum lupini]UQC81295.1 hypothetical protein CLUP02_06781 [Colletotrichum lupini]
MAPLSDGDWLGQEEKQEKHDRRERFFLQERRNCKTSFKLQVDPSRPLGFACRVSVNDCFATGSCRQRIENAPKRRNSRQLEVFFLAARPWTQVSGESHHGRVDQEPELPKQSSEWHNLLDFEFRDARNWPYGIVSSIRQVKKVQNYQAESTDTKFANGQTPTSLSRRYGHAGAESRRRLGRIRATTVDVEQSTSDRFGASTSSGQVHLQGYVLQASYFDNVGGLGVRRRRRPCLVGNGSRVHVAPMFQTKSTSTKSSLKPTPIV